MCAAGWVLRLPHLPRNIPVKTRVVFSERDIWSHNFLVSISVKLEKLTFDSLHHQSTNYFQTIFSIISFSASHIGQTTIRSPYRIPSEQFRTYFLVLSHLKFSLPSFHLVTHHSLSSFLLLPFILYLLSSYCVIRASYMLAIKGNMVYVFVDLLVYQEWQAKK